jgi:hypothetical protein
MAGLALWDRIQCQVEIVVELKKDNSPVDFCVILVDPRHDRDRIQDYLGASIASLLLRQGYTAIDEPSLSRQKRPICLCLVLNFCDLLTSAETTLSESDVSQMTFLALQHCSDLEPSQLLLQCTSTSLYNCYGLAGLHHFIYQSYLVHKEWKLNESLRAVQQAQLDSRQHVPGSVSYKDYLRNLDEVSSAAAEQQESQMTSTTSSQHPTRPRPRERHPNSGTAPRHKQQDKKQQRNDRRLHDVSAKHTSLDAKNALEAFLAADEDENLGALTATPTFIHNDTSSSDHEDDFFYDESGMRKPLVDEASLVESVRTTARNTPNTTERSSIDKSSGKSRGEQHSLTSKSRVGGTEQQTDERSENKKKKKTSTSRRGASRSSASRSEDDDSMGDVEHDKDGISPRTATTHVGPSSSDDESDIVDTSCKASKSNQASEETVSNREKDAVEGQDEPSLLVNLANESNGDSQPNNEIINQEQVEECVSQSGDRGESNADVVEEETNGINVSLGRGARDIDIDQDLAENTCLQQKGDNVQQDDMPIATTPVGPKVQASAKVDDSDEDEFFLEAEPRQENLAVGDIPGEGKGMDRLSIVHDDNAEEALVEELASIKKNSTALTENRQSVAETPTRGVTEADPTKLMTPCQKLSPSGLSAAAQAAIAAAKEQAELMLREAEEPEEGPVQKSKKKKNKKEKKKKKTSNHSDFSSECGKAYW